MFPFNDVPFYYANLVGYLRIAFVLYCHVIMRSSPHIALLLYTLNALLDTVDGYLARKYNQCSRFGAILDQLTDRCAFLGLLMHLCEQYTGFCAYCFQMVALIDIFSHWLHVHACDLEQRGGHKFSKNWIVNIYYTSNLHSSVVCYGCEIFYLAVYGMAYYKLGFWGRVFQALAAMSAPIAFAKTIVSIVQLVAAWQAVIDYDRRNAYRLRAAEMAVSHDRTLHFE